MIFVASAWGVRHGGINAFNTELAQAMAQLADDRTVGCAVLSSDQVDEAKARDHRVELICLDDHQRER